MEDHVIEKRFDRLEQMIGQVVTIVMEHSARFDAIDAKFVEIDARFDTIDARFEKLEATVVATNVKIDELQDDIRNLDAKLTARIDDVEATLSARIDDANAKRDAQVQDIEQRLTLKIERVEASLLTKINIVNFRVYHHSHFTNRRRQFRAVLRVR